VKLYLSAPLLFLLALLQATLMPAVAGVRPDLVLAAVVCWGLLEGPTEGAIWGLVGGFALDLLSGAPFGIHSFVLTMVGTLAGFGSALIPSEHALLLPGMSVLCTIVEQGAEVWLFRQAGWPLEWGPVLIAVVAPAAVLNLLLTLVLYPLTGLLHRRTAPVERGW
jgi:rod shape-determining protein MreD